MTKRLEGKIAAITGGTSGIGLASAKEFIVEGAKVSLLARSQAKLDEALDEVGGGAIGFIGDVADLSSLEAFYKSLGVLFPAACGVTFIRERVYTQES